MKYQIEICASSMQSVINATRCLGVDRIELCCALPLGGLTPSIGTLISTVEWLKVTKPRIKIHVLIRPREGDFCYKEYEKYEMIRTIVLLLECGGVDGLVFGALKPNGDVDMDFCDEVIQLCTGKLGKIGTFKPIKNFTFHRAFDMCRDPQKALEQIISLGFNRILTSGCAATAEDGIPVLKTLIKQADGRIDIMPGCGINSKNIRKIAEATGAKSFHMSCSSEMESNMAYQNPKVSMGGTVHVDEYSLIQTDPEKVQACIDALKK